MPLSYPTKPAEIDHMIANDHAVVARLFEHLEAQRGDRRVLVDQVSFQLAIHADAEERVLYPALADAGMRAQSGEALDEHQAAKDLLAVLGRTEPGEPEFEQSLAALMADIRHHVAEEETQILPQFRAKVGPEMLVALGQQFLEAKRTAPTFDAHGRQATLATDASGLLNQQAQAIVDALSSLEPKPVAILTPEKARRQPGPDDAVKELLRQQGKPTDPEPVGSVEDMTIRGAAGQDLTIRIYKPVNAGDQLPVLLWIHGGGWVLFDINTYDASCRGLTNKTGAIVVSPDYRRAPEAVFPASHDDVLATWKWITENAASFGGDATRIGIGGESVGGNMAAATTLQLKQAGQPLPAAQVLVYPLTTAEQFGDSYLDAADGVPLNRPTVSWMAMYAFEGVPDGPTDPRINLLGLSAEQLGGFPPTLVITDERDPLRSQGQEFAKHLQAAGVDTIASHYEGVMHEFFGASAVLADAERAQQEAATHLTNAFTRAPAVDPYPKGHAAQASQISQAGVTPL